jgi:hypothetical protein
MALIMTEFVILLDCLIAKKLRVENYPSAAATFNFQLSIFNSSSIQAITKTFFICIFAKSIE